MVTEVYSHIMDAQHKENATKFGDEFYNVEVLNDRLKLVVAGDAHIDVHLADKYNFDDYSFTHIDSDFDASGIERLCSSINKLLAENGINVKYRAEKQDIVNAERSLRDSVDQEYCSTGRLDVRYACDITLKSSS